MIKPKPSHLKEIDFRTMLTGLGFDTPRNPGRVAGRKFMFPKFTDTHGHARNPKYEERQFESSTRASRMYTAVATTSWCCKGQVWMPNLNPNPIDTAHRLREYHAILNGTEDVFMGEHPEYSGLKMQHNIALRLGSHSIRIVLAEAGRAMDELGMPRIAKIYPDGVTTNSSGGWNDLSAIYQQIEDAASLDFIICLHGEQPGQMIDTYDRERRFLDLSFGPLVDRFPGVRFHLEHITTRAAVDMVKQMPDTVGAGITLHHLVLSTNDVLEWQPAPGSHVGINPHHHCRPPAQKFDDQKALLEVALNASQGENVKFCFGSDSAPHIEATKMTPCGCAGVMSSPVCGAVMVGLFDAAGKIDGADFGAFVRGNAKRFYGITSDESDCFALEFSPWVVPKLYGGIVPLYAGCQLPWAPVAGYINNPREVQ